MMHCPECGASARTRTSRRITNETKESYHQCLNLLCGCTFTTLQAVDKILTKPVRVSTEPLPDGLFRTSHLGDEQIDLTFK